MSHEQYESVMNTRIKVKSENSFHDTSGGKLKYQCPMKCEGEKTYDEPGRCPVCKMYLKPLE